MRSLPIASLLATLVVVAPDPAAGRQAAAPQQPPACPASSSWVSNPAPPQEIPDGGQDFCDFYQFAWQ
jgi:hypothetical protein